MKQILHTLWIFLVLLAGFTACTDETIVNDESGNVLPNGDVALQITANIPAPREVVTRDIDPDCLGVNTLYLFCFDEFGGYIGRREATNFQAVETGRYSFSAAVPAATRRIHFLANIYLDDITATPGMSETTLIPSIVTVSGRMVYWGRTVFTNKDALETFNNGENITLYRNQARVSWRIIGGEQTNGLKVFGYALCNRRAWGTAAPFNSNAEDGASPFEFNLDAPYVTEPSGDYRVLASDPTEVTVQSAEDGDPHYMFETPNTLDEPVFAVMKIGTDESNAKYYKIMFVDDEKNQLPIYRNYEYVISIKALPDQMGYDTFENAKKGIAANNAWVSVDPEIPELSDGIRTLNILNGTTQIFNEGGIQTIDFTYTGGTSDDLSVSWLVNDGSLSSQVPEIVTGNNGYQIKMDLATPGDNPIVGTLLLRAGAFSRQIKIYLMKPFEFKPVWVSTGVPMEKGERMSMTFVIPDNYPEELFPITCKIGTNKMNANDDLGVQLPIISENCEYVIDNELGTGITASTNWGYKFVYTATRSGIQEVFFTLNVSEGNDPTGTVTYGGGDCPYADKDVNHTHVFLEAEGFKDEEKVVLFQGSDSNRRITIKGAADNNPGFLLKELSPTVNQPVEITLNFEGGTPDANTVMRMATTALKPDLVKYPGEASYYISGIPGNGVVNYYWIKPGVSNQLTLHFLTTSANVDDLVRFSIDNENDSGYNSDNTKWFKSAAVELRATPKQFTFDFNIADDNSETTPVKYGVGQHADLYFSIPQVAVQYTDLTLFIKTKNLEPDPEGPNAKWLSPVDGGYTLNIPMGTVLEERGTIKLLTKRIASAETVTISTVDDSQALFAPASAAFTNLPVTGTISCDGLSLSTSSFITLERANGTRVGDFNITEAGTTAKYELILRSEYDFTMDEPLTVYYNSLESEQKIYTAKIESFRQLINHEIGQDGLYIELKPETSVQP